MATTCAYITSGEVAWLACCRQTSNLIGLSKGKKTHKKNMSRASNCSREHAENKSNAAVNERQERTDLRMVYQRKLWALWMDDYILTKLLTVLSATGVHLFFLVALIYDVRVARTLVLERYNNETTKRYTLDMHSRLTVMNEVHKEMTSTDKNVFQMYIQHPRLPSIIKEFVLPSGYPGSVSDDYLEYMLWQFPTNVTAWICSTIVTSSLLKAIGIGSLPSSIATATTAAATAASIKWVSKDGVGALGRLVIGGRFGGLFDNDPKQWRMYADFIGSAGSIFELATPLVPEYFLPLASLGNLTKAIARGLKDPSFRVIQNHFAVSGNLGDVAAKVGQKCTREA